MALHVRSIAMIGLPILLALLFAASQTMGGSGSLEDALFDEPAPPALELLQRSAKVNRIAKGADDVAHGPHHHKAKGPKTVSAQAASGVSGNGVGNLPIFITGIITDLMIILVCLCMFTYFSGKYPIIYQDNHLKGFAPSEVPAGTFGWCKASWNVTLDEVWNSAGLDHAMLLEFLNLSLNTFKWIALPMFFIMGPMNCAFGGNAAGLDHESWFSMGNVQFHVWLYWPISFAIVYVAWCVCSMCHVGVKKFLPMRFEWLRAVEKVQANTIMMTGIPTEFQSDQKCKEFWDTMLPGGRVVSVNLVKDTSDGNVKGLHAQKVAATYQGKLAEDAWAKDDKDPDKRPKIKTSFFGAQEDAIDAYKKQVDELVPQITEAKNNVYKKAQDVAGVNLSAGFVTFKDRSDAEVALSLELAADSNLWVLDYPPLPQDIIWEDLTQDPNAEAGRALLGYALTAGLVIVYMPLVVFICNVAELINMGPLQPIWSSEAPSLGLTIMVDFLPTILMLIFTHCFSLYNKTAAQYKLSVWYWWMNVLYVVCVTALGTNFLSFAETLAKDPLSLFSLLADTMPECTHYYMNYIGMQYYVHAMVLTRYVPLIKFTKASRSHEEQEAKDMAEPEDQDYYGIGSRTARWSTLFCIGIVYGTLSPPVSLLTFGLFAWLRLIYGYLWPWAETKKSDMGGIFFMRALHNSYLSLHIYMVLMIGVFCQRAPSWGPVLVIAIGWASVFHSQKKFNEFKWERLPYPVLAEGGKVTHRIQELKGNYVQPELND